MVPECRLLADYRSGRPVDTDIRRASSFDRNGLVSRHFGRTNAVTLLLAALSLFTGTGKAVSVCGINSALVARPSAGASRLGMAGYVGGLAIGALILSLLVVFAGGLVLRAVPIGFADRRFAAGLAIIGIGAVEALLGAPLLPHIQWAVPQAWSRALRADPFLIIFGAIRGVAVFNHSPFASMHAWLLVLFLLPEAASPLAVGIALAIGLMVWSGAVAALRVLDPMRKDRLLLDMTGRSLAATHQLGRIDGAALVVFGSVLLLSVA
jgi:hypothetical protein